MGRGHNANHLIRNDFYAVRLSIVKKVLKVVGMTIVHDS